MPVCSGYQRKAASRHSFPRASQPVSATSFASGVTGLPLPHALFLSALPGPRGRTHSALLPQGIPRLGFFYRFEGGGGGGGVGG